MIWPLTAWIIRNRVAVAAATAALMAYAYHRDAVNDAQRAGYAAAEADMQARVIEANNRTLQIEQRQRELSAAAAAKWESDRNDLESQVAGLLSRPGKPIRLCQQSSPGSRELPRDAGATSGAADSTGGAVDAVSSGLDLRSAIVLYGGDCERYRLQLKGLQEWLKTEALAKR